MHFISYFCGTLSTAFQNIIDGEDVSTHATGRMTIVHKIL